MAKVRLSGAFVTRWYEEWAIASGQLENAWQTTEGEHHRILELFLEQFGGEIARVLKHQLLEALLADVAKMREVGEAVHAETLGDA